jgi:COMPASS component SPP1
LSEEEKEFLENAAATRFHLAEETVLCHKMLTLLDLAHSRRQAAISAGHFKEDICGYDQRLDTISARDAFAAFAKSPEGEAIFKASKLGDPLGEDDDVRGMCERKRCKIHSGWYKMLSLGIKYQIRELASQAGEVGEEEKVVRQAAKERWRRKRSEKNWVQVLDG